MSNTDTVTRFISFTVKRKSIRSGISAAVALTKYPMPELMLSAMGLDTQPVGNLDNHASASASIAANEPS